MQIVALTQSRGPVEAIARRTIEIHANTFLKSDSHWGHDLTAPEATAVVRQHPFK